MREYRLTVLTAAFALALAVIGGLVDPGEASLACPDWPLCNGRVLPSLSGAVLVEHGHRIVALAVAVLTAIVAALVVRNRSDRGLRRLAFAAVALVGAQAALGALTVVFGLPVAARLAHLATAMTFFAVVVHLAARLRPAPSSLARP
jgi:heme A synthase